MTIKFYIFGMLLASFFGFSQNVNSDTSKSSVAIKSNFSTEAVKVYQESANLKLDDFYNYLSLYSDAKTSDAFKAEIRKNIFRLYGKDNFEIIDFLSNDNQRIAIANFLSKIENKNYDFAISYKFNSPADFQSWNCSYQLKIYFGNDFSVKNINQKINFLPIEKSFGNTTKTVWAVYLGGFY